MLSSVSALTRRSAAVTAAVLAVGVVPASVAATTTAESDAAAPAHQHGERRPDFDARESNGRTLITHRSAAAAKLDESLGARGIVDIDPATGTARRVARLDGFLTARSNRSAVRIATDFLRAHPEAFGLDAAEVAALRLRKDYADIEGTHHLSFEQVVGGVPVVGNGLRADVTKDGRLIQITGSPVAALPADLDRPELTAAQARDTALRDAGPTATASSNDSATLVAFATRNGVRPAWQLLSLREGYRHVIDAVTGRILQRQDLLHHDNAPSALVWQNYPGAPRGGRAEQRSLKKWIAPGATTLSGESAHVFLDVNADIVANEGEEVAPNAPGDWRFPFKDFTGQVGPPCAASARCSWDPKVAYSWKDNAKQNAVQLFYYVSAFHDHLAAAPIGFNRAAGSYDAVDGDPFEVSALFGANTDGNGLPDGYTNGAMTIPPPDGTPGRMAMMLFAEDPLTGDPFLPTNAGDLADVAYHEYTHGMAHRLVVDASGNSTFHGAQAGAMDEGTADWYAFDRLAATGVQPDTAKPGEMLVGRYVSGGRNLIRSQPLDCGVGVGAKACPGTPSTGPGGYTYGDYGKINPTSRAHANGEIWSETLWDLRTALGSKTAQSLVTRALELSPANPSFLDMRNSILLADRVNHDGRDQRTIWRVFAGRGMGWFAADLGTDDTSPIEDFTVPPAGEAKRTSVSGSVTDPTSGKPLAGATITFPGHDSGFPGSYQAVTDPEGRYTISGVRPGGTYPRVNASAPGYETVLRDVRVRTGRNKQDWALRRNWATTATGGEVTDFNGEDWGSGGCGPGAAVDNSQHTGWLTDTVHTEGRIDPRYLVVRLPSTIDVSAIAVDPTAPCGSDLASTTGDYRVETSPDGQNWKVAAHGHFGAGDRFRMNEVSLAEGSTAAVRYLRYTMLGNHLADDGIVCPGLDTACNAVGTTEIGVYGTAR